ncbi:MAG TPA: DUF885 family protein [Candidatus Cybelea sp.]
MKQRALGGLLLAALIVVAPLRAPAQNTPAEHISALQLQGLADFLSASPEAATFLGDYSHDGDWSDPTPAGLARMKQMLDAFSTKLSAIDTLLERDGLYGNDLDGRHAVAQFERLRGARAIVDTKLATGAWSYQRAVAWFAANAGVDQATAQGEVSRFALGPGQAFDYAVGKVQIEDLLAQYRAKKGAAFSLEEFHNDLLSHGAVPVSIIASDMLAQ